MTSTERWYASIAAPIMELAGTLIVAASFSIEASPFVSIGNKPLAAVTVDTGFWFYVGWALLAGGLLLQAFLAWIEKPKSNP